MNRGFYAMATGMLVERQRMDVITNNIVNVETTGFKKDQLVSRSFDDVLIERINDPNVLQIRNGVGDINHGVHIDEIETYHTQGNTEVTGRTLDITIDGNGLFAIQTPNGERYTRNGNFVLDVDGYLLTTEGYFVLGQNGPIQLDSDNFSINSEGLIVNEQLQDVDTLRIVTLEDWSQLRKEGNNLYYVYGDAPVQQATDYAVVQGTLENSNVDIAREMVDLITSYRAYETGQRILQMLDEVQDKAANRIASV